MATDDNAADLSLVVDSIKQASDRELKVLSEISAKLDSGMASGMVSSDASSDQPAIINKPKKVPNKHAKRRTNATAKQRPGEVTTQLATRATQSESDAATESGAVSQIERANIAPSAIANEVPSKPEKDKGTEKKAQPIIVNQKESGKATSAAPDSSPVRVEVNSSEVDVQGIQKAVKSGLSAFDNYWKDEKGRLRRANGTYASKEERSQYQKTAAEIAKERQDEKQSGVITKMIGAVKRFANREDPMEANGATDAAGAAAGGSWFYAAKELYNVGENVVSSASNAIDKSEKLKEKWTSVKSFSLRDRFSNSKREGSALPDASKVNHVAGSKGGPDSLLNRTKQASVQSEQSEILKEQTVEQKQSNEKIIDLLDEISSNSRSAGSDGGLMSGVSSISDLLGGRGRRGRGGRSRGRVGKSVSVAKKAPKGGRLKSVLSATGKKTAGVASTGMSMAGKAFRGVSTVAKGAGKLVPFLAPVLAAYDAFSGFTDTEKQKEVFDLKDGQEATTGQKAAMAAGNLLDMGGLVSGGAGLVGDALGALGFDKAKEALTFDSGSMAKSIYSFFGGGDKSKSQKQAEAINKTAKGSTQNVSLSAVPPVPTSSTSSASSLAGGSPAVIDNMPVAKVAAIGAGVAGAAGVASMASAPGSEFQSTRAISADPVMQSTNHVNRVQVNRSASSIMAEKSQQKFNEKTGPELVRLDKKSIDDITKGVKQANIDLTTTIVESSKSSAGTKQSGEPRAVSPQSGGIPNNFEDRSLQRQSADLE